MENLHTIKENLEEFLESVSRFQIEQKDINYAIETKSSQVDFVTSVDKKSDEMIIEYIKKHYPHHQILTEEHGTIGGKSDWCWVIDPIDGTTNFIHKYPLHSISVGLEFQNETVLGMVVLPILGMKFYAIKGEGAFLNDKPIFVSKTASLSQSLISTGFPYNRAKENPNLEYFNKIINHIAGIRRSGSAAIDICFCAAGFCDGYFEFNINKWDYCAGKLILEEARGTSKKFIFGNNTMYFFTNSFIDKELENKLFL